MKTQHIRRSDMIQIIRNFESTHRGKIRHSATKRPKREREKKRSNVGREGERHTKYWAPTPSSPHPFGPPPLVGSTLRPPNAKTLTTNLAKNCLLVSDTRSTKGEPTRNSKLFCSRQVCLKWLGPTQSGGGGWVGEEESETSGGS